MQIDKQETTNQGASSVGGDMSQAQTKQALPPAHAGDTLVSVTQYLHRFVGSHAELMVVRTFLTPSGQRYTRTTYEPWMGL
jgi:hypothetical protein